MAEIEGAGFVAGKGECRQMKRVIHQSQKHILLPKRVQSTADSDRAQATSSQEIHHDQPTIPRSINFLH